MPELTAEEIAACRAMIGLLKEVISEEYTFEVGRDTYICRYCGHEICAPDDDPAFWHDNSCLYLQTTLLAERYPNVGLGQP